MESTEEFKKLIRECQKAKETAYCPYSQFRVGCALITADGHMYTGSNVENACYGLSLCAERTTVCKAVTEGHREFKAIAVGTDIKHTFKGPCGACRQFMVEFGECDLYLVKPDLTYMKLSSDQLLPFGFGPKDLQAERI
ncbi:cytidine deaminase-like [Glandiceps talaboti]